MTDPGEQELDPDSDLAAEQAVLDKAHACLTAMRDKTTRVLAQARADAEMSTAFDAQAIRLVMENRLLGLAESKAPLTFGRIDTEDGDRHHIGRRHVEDEQGVPVVIDWRAPVSTPFYRATWADPLGLNRRRRLAVDRRTVAGLFDEDFTDPNGADHGASGGVPDPLLAELDRGRTGAMRDIVATIQAEQDVIIRAPLEDCVVVQGGPGTGKTAVGLHRAAFLLYEYRRELERQKLLVVGPNELFLKYISDVLPSLGETAVVQTTLEGLVARTFPIGRTESDTAVSRLKGDARFGEVLRRFAVGRIRPIDVDAILMSAFGSVVIAAEEVQQFVKTVLSRDVALNDARESLKTKLLQLAWQSHLERPRSDPSQHDSFMQSLKVSKEFKTLHDGIWPAMTAAPMVTSLLASSGAALAIAADGVLNRDELQLLKRGKARGEKGWSRADLGLLDEAASLTNGVDRKFGHVVVDEAQDLSSMELRMVGRRSARRSLTVLGDLAQATSPGGQRSWEQALQQLLSDAPGSSTGEGRIAELTLGYRVPAPVIEVANRLLPLAAPGLRPSKSVRMTGSPPAFVRVEPAELASVVAERVSALELEHGTVAVIGPVALLDQLLRALTDAGVEVADGRTALALDRPVTLLGAVASKGLEFDAVLVVEPAAILAESTSGPRALFVAMTRPVQLLQIVHAEDVPSVLLAPSV